MPPGDMRSNMWVDALGIWSMCIICIAYAAYVAYGWMLKPSLWVSLGFLV